jgi:predicted DNA-binding protein
VAARLPRELIERLDRWAATHGVTRSEAIRQIIEAALPQ